jgi:membrane protease YdiL (CAAX protease family)
VVVTAACFGVLHVDPNGIHMALAFVMGLYLGFVSERSGSTLPAIVCHVVNNVVYTVQTALGGTLEDRGLNAAVAGGCAVLFLGCVAWLRRAAPPPSIV